jgi:U4/U6.U5 tri-snRNP-associated protein 2
MAEPTRKLDSTHSNDDLPDSERPLKKPRTDEEDDREDDEQEDDEQEPVRPTGAIKASDLYLDTASIMTLESATSMFT